MIVKWFEWIKHLLGLFAPSQNIESSHIKLNEEYKKLNDFLKKTIAECEEYKNRLEERSDELILKLNTIRDDSLRCEEEKHKLKMEIYKLKNKKEDT